MVSMLVTSVVDCGFYPWSGQTKNWYLLLVKACSIKENKSKDLLIWSQDNLSNLSENLPVDCELAYC